jgi:hypothetical protein
VDLKCRDARPDPRQDPGQVGCLAVRSDDLGDLLEREKWAEGVTISYSNTRPPSGFQRIDKLPVGSLAPLSE